MRNAAVLSATALCALIGCASPTAGIDARKASYLKAVVLFGNGRFEEAAALAEPGGLAGFGVFVPAAVLRGKALWFLGRPKRAEADFRAALRSRPSSLEARLWLGRVLRAEGRLGEAARLAESLLADDGDDPRALRLASELALDRNDPSAAAGFIERAVAGGEELGLVFIDRARFRWISGGRADALRDLAAAAAVLPKDGAARRAALSLKKTIEEASE